MQVTSNEALAYAQSTQGVRFLPHHSNEEGEF